MKYSDNFFDILFNDKKLINIKKNKQQLPTAISGTQRTLVFSVPLETDAEKELLANILAACQLETKDYLIVPKSIPYAHFSGNQHIKDVLIFGIPEQELGISVYFPYNFCFSFNERIIIRTGSIAEIMANKQLKNDLWQKALKLHFLPINLNP